MLHKLKKYMKEHKLAFLETYLIGGLALIVNYIIFLLLLKMINTNYLVSAAIGYISGAFFGLYLNKKYKLELESKKYTLQNVKYLIVYATSLFMGLLLLTVLVSFGVNIPIAYIIILGFVTLTNYTGTKHFVLYESYIIKKVSYWIYRFRYLITYIIIGVSSILLEIVFIAIMSNFYTDNYLNKIGGFGIGVVFAFVLNSRLNFKVPKERNLRTFSIFVIISIFAFALNIVLISLIFTQTKITSYSVTRLISAASVFLISYTLHRKITFIDVKEVGIPIYLSENEDVLSIKNKVRYYPDFIHFDLVDQSFNQDAKAVDITKGYEAKGYWSKLTKMTHIMSKSPSKWIKKVSSFSDYIIIHAETKENLGSLINEIKRLNKKAGISIIYNTPLKEIREHLGKVDLVQILGIRKPGESSQHMETSAIRKLNEINAIKRKYSFQLCFDGGIRLTNIHRINAKYIVSGSTVLKSKEIMESIHAIKTSSKYYYEGDKELKEYLKESILKILNKIDFVVSGTIVGSFVEKPGIEGISDVDIIIIMDELTKEKYNIILGEFQELKKNIEADFDRETIINPTFGPLKFDKDNNVVLHVMIYDVKQHISHCKKSPFTCLDWQRSEVYTKKKMDEIYKVYMLEPSNFFNSRRSITDYLKDLNTKRISYRSYTFKGNQVIQVLNFKKMENKDIFEFSYHIMKFIMVNFVKLYYKDNKARNIDDILKSCFLTSRKNKQFFLKISEYKEHNKYPEWNNKHETQLREFIRNFEIGFKKYFFREPKKIYLIRHAETEQNKEEMFVGQKSNPSVKRIDKKQLALKIKRLNIKHIMTSPSIRCIQTSNLIKEIVSSKQLIIEEKLKEIDYGLVDGRDYNYLKERYPKMIKEWDKGLDPRFPNGENQQDVCDRVNPIVGKIVNNYFKDNLLICTHNVVIKCILGQSLKIPKEKWYLMYIPHLEPIELIFLENKKLYINLDEKQREKIFQNFG